MVPWEKCSFVSSFIFFCHVEFASANCCEKSGCEPVCDGMMALGRALYVVSPLLLLHACIGLLCYWSKMSSKKKEEHECVLRGEGGPWRSSASCFSVLALSFCIIFMSFDSFLSSLPSTFLHINITFNSTVDILTLKVLEIDRCLFTETQLGFLVTDASRMKLGSPPWKNTHCHRPSNWMLRIWISDEPCRCSFTSMDWMPREKTLVIRWGSCGRMVLNGLYSGSPSKTTKSKSNKLFFLSLM